MIEFLQNSIPDTFCSNPEWINFLDNVQGNVIRHHNLNHSRLVFIRFDEDMAPLDLAKEWIADFSVYVTSALRQLNTFNKNLDAFKGPEFPERMHCSFLISREGLNYLGLASEGIEFPETTYLDIAKLSDDRDNLEDFFRKENHIMILLAHNQSEEILIDFIQKKVVDSLYTNNIRFEHHVEKGMLLRNEDGKVIEAFGFRDGISQPEVMMEKIIPDLAWDSSATLDLAFFKTNLNEGNDYGSFATYLKIEQDVGIFKENTREIAGKIEDDLGEEEKNQLAAAYIMGRFRNGIPLMNYRDHEDKPLNDFNFDSPDSEHKCPFFSHIFKANPRGRKSAPKIQIFRRGVSFKEGDGMHFLSYQGAFSQFTNIYSNWIASYSNPGAPVFGTDILLMMDKGANTGTEREEHSNLKPFTKKWGIGNKLNYSKNLYFLKSELNLKKPTIVRGVVFYFVPSLYFLENIQNL